MKTKIFFSAATLSVLFVYYSTQLLQAVESNVNAGVIEASAGNQGGVVLPETTSLSASISTLTTSPQSVYNRFKVDNTRQVEVVGRKGTRLVLPPDIFEDEAGNSVNGEVEIIMKECYELDEILAEKLSTTSGSRIIETAGMIHLDVRQGSTPLRLKNEARYTVFFPTRGNSREGFELFYGTQSPRGVIDWQAASTPNQDETAYASRQPTTVRDDCFIQICESEFRRRTQISEMDYFNWQLTDGQTLNQWFVSNFNPDVPMVDAFCSDKLVSRIAFHVNPDGSFKDYYVAHESKPTYDRAIAEFLSTMPPLDLSRVMPVYSSDHLCVLAFGHQQGTSGDEFVKRFAKKFSTPNDTLAMTGVSGSDLDYYMFTSTELGWLNCDRFYSEESPLVEFRVNAGTAGGTSVSMVFEDRKSIVRGIMFGGEFVFSGVPYGKKIRLIAVDSNGGSPRIQEAHTNTSKKSYRMNEYEPMTLAKLDAAMCWK